MRPAEEKVLQVGRENVAQAPLYRRAAIRLERG